MQWFLQYSLHPNVIKFCTRMVLGRCLQAAVMTGSPWASNSGRFPKRKGHRGSLASLNHVEGSAKALGNQPNSFRGVSGVHKGFVGICSVWPSDCLSQLSFLSSKKRKLEEPTTIRNTKSMDVFVSAFLVDLVRALQRQPGLHLVATEPSVEVASRFPGQIPGITWVVCIQANHAELIEPIPRRLYQAGHEALKQGAPGHQAADAYTRPGSQVGWPA